MAKHIQIQNDEQDFYDLCDKFNVMEKFELEITHGQEIEPRVTPIYHEFLDNAQGFPAQELV